MLPMESLDPKGCFGMTRKMLSLISLRALCLAMLVALIVPIHADAQGSSVRFERLSLEEGLNNPEIAERLTVSRSTAKAHVSHILSKLGVPNRAGAIALALQQ